MTGAGPSLLLIQWGRRGGGPRYTLDLAQALADLQGDHRVSVSYSSNGELADRFATLAMPQLPVATFTSAASAALAVLRLPWTALRLWRFARAHEVDLVYVTMESPLVVAALLLVRPLLRARVLVGVHDATVHPGDRALEFSLIRRLTARCADAVMVFSTAVRQAVAADRRVRVPVHQTFLPFSGERAAAPRELPTDRPIRIGFFGRLLPYKGLDLLADAFLLLTAGSADVELRVYGEGHLPATLNQLRARPDVSIVNAWLQDDAISGIVAEFDVLVLPYREASQSGAIGFAVSAGVPVVATPVGGIAEQVAISASGVVVEDVSAAALADGIQLLCGDPARYAAASRAAFRSAARFSWDAAANELLQLATIGPALSVRARSTTCR